MTTPVTEGGVKLVPINLTTPAARGLNTEAEGSLQTPEWATILDNAVFDSSGRAAGRLGWTSQTATPGAGIIKRVFEYYKADKTTETISSTDSDIFKGTAAPTSIDGSLTITEGNIKFVNFYDNCYALGTGTSSNPSKYTGTGDFTTITVTTGTAPTGSIGLSAYGRLWVTDADNQNIKYSALLDETRWHVDDGGGNIDMGNVWPAGTDSVIAIEEFAGDLVIFGKNNIVVWTDGQGSNLGIDPTVMYVADTLPGVGAVSQFAISRAKGDLWFLSPNGVQSLSRAIQEKTTPTTNISKNVQSDVLAWLTAESDEDDITMMSSPINDFVLVTFPTSNKVVCFDTRGQMEDGTYRVTTWDSTLQTCAYFVGDRGIYGSLTGTVGEIMKYSGSSDDGEVYNFKYESGWIDFGEANQYLKIVKKLTSFMWVDSNTDVNFTMQYDFSTLERTETKTVTGGISAMFDLSEFTGSDTNAAYIGYNDPAATSLTESEFGGGVSLQIVSVPGRGYGQYLKVGVNLDTAGSAFALQQINLYAKIGRIA